MNEEKVADSRRDIIHRSLYEKEDDNGEKVIKNRPHVTKKGRHVNRVEDFAEAKVSCVRWGSDENEKRYGRHRICGGIFDGHRISRCHLKETKGDI